jgi:hypothetical protein
MNPGRRRIGGLGQSRPVCGAPSGNRRALMASKLTQTLEFTYRPRFDFRCWR